LPVQIGDDTDWEKIAAGQGHNLAIKTDGTLWSWGLNFNGQCGDGTTTDVVEPTQIGEDTDWVSISAGGGHSLAIKADGSLWAWGANGSGQLGIGNVMDVPLPAQVGEDTDWSEVSAGFEFSLFRKSNGLIYSSGFNANGQLGLGDNLSVNVPTLIGDESWASIEAGSSYAFALSPEDELFGWGFNAFGQLGIGSSNSNVLTPTAIVSETVWNLVSAAEGLIASGGLFGYHSVGLKGQNLEICGTGLNDQGQLGLEGVGSLSEFSCEAGILLSASVPAIIQPKLKLYPSPSSGNVTIESTIGHGVIFVIDMTGRKVFQKQMNNARANLDLHFLPSGLYNIVLTDDEVRLSEQIVIAR